MQSRQHMQPGTASMYCNQGMYADRPNCSGVQTPGGLAGRGPQAIVEGSLHKMSGQHGTQGWKGGPPEPELLWRRGSCRVLPEIARGDAKRPVDEDAARVSARLPKYPSVGRS